MKMNNQFLKIGDIYINVSRVKEIKTTSQGSILITEFKSENPWEVEKENAEAFLIENSLVPENTP